jgi:hypothetical protein
MLFAPRAIVLEALDTSKVGIPIFLWFTEDTKAGNYGQAFIFNNRNAKVPKEETGSFVCCSRQVFDVLCTQARIMEFLVSCVSIILRDLSHDVFIQRVSPEMIHTL